MRAAVYHGAGRVSLDEVPEPALPLGGLLVEVNACGICGSDLMNWYQDTKAPTVLGHEPVGLVLDGEVGQIGPGDRVYVHHHVPCLDCDLCRAGRDTLCANFRSSRIEPGGLAERIAVPDEIARLDVLPIPDDLSDAAASIIEPLGCVLRGQRLAGVRAGARVAVVGCGSMGLLEMAAAVAAGAEAVVGVEPRADRRQLAERSGHSALATSDPDAVAEALGGPADAVFVCTSNAEAIASALHLAGPGGVVQLFAPPKPGTPITLDLGAVWWREVTIQSTYSAGPEDTRAALALLSRGRIDGEALISHRVPLEAVEEAFRLARSGDAVKVLVQMT
jgi:L-iditol 2-dehydrogenase